MTLPPFDTKDCGGYIGGLLRPTPQVPHKNCDDQPCEGLHKNVHAIVSRSMVALDADTASQSFVVDVEMDLPDTAAVLYPTWSYTATEPRWRAVFPLSRDVTPEEYQYIALALMQDLGADQFDKGSAEPSRMMHLPSTQGHSPEVVVLDGGPLDADAWLLRAGELGVTLAVNRLAGVNTYDGPAYDAMAPEEQERAEDYVNDLRQTWAKRFAGALDWDEDKRDARGRGWEALVRDCAWAFACLVHLPWAGIDEHAAEALFNEVVPEAIAEDEKCVGKWYDGLVDKAIGEPVINPPWRDSPFDVWVDPDAEDDEEDLLGDVGGAGGSTPPKPPPAASGQPRRPPVDVTDPAKTLRWLRNEVGKGNLSGMFQRSGELVHTPRVGEKGYVPPRNTTNDDGPAQVRRVGYLELAARVDFGYTVEQQMTAPSGGTYNAAALFPREPAARVLAVVDLLGNCRDLMSVTHTPVVRPDGSILDLPGYDDSTRMLYLPDPELKVGRVPEEPSAVQVQAAVDLLEHMLTDFPFVTTHDKANYLGGLLTPLLRPLVPPPYQLLAIGAPQPGSGKSLLALIYRLVHGGVFKSEFPDSDAELSKVVTATLDGTSAPVVQFDNVNGTLKSSVLDGLLTSADWSDRLLGQSKMLVLNNDRLWVVTGNNINIGGDLARRVLWVTINVGAPHPELRTGFAIADLEGWVRDNRGRLLNALLTLIRHWDVLGRPVEDAPTSDSFGTWLQVLRGIVDAAGFDESVGQVGHQDTKQRRVDVEEDEWGTFLEAAYRVFGTEPWTARELVDRVVEHDANDDAAAAFGGPSVVAGISEDDLPGDLGSKVVRDQVGTARSLGKWLSARVNRWSGNLSVQEAGGAGKKARHWVLVEVDSLGKPVR
jgi:hypothetical protein